MVGSSWAPSTRSVELFNQIGWSIGDPPSFFDHDGFAHNLMSLPYAALDALLQEAWLQHVAHRVQHRRTMQDLTGICTELTLLDRAGMTPHELSRVMALQSGAFISEWSHAKFNKPKASICARCLLPNTLRHWFQCPLHAEQRAQMQETFDWTAEMPDCTVHHLLAPRCQFELLSEHYFMNLRRQHWQASTLRQEREFKICFLMVLLSLNSPKYVGVGAWSLVNCLYEACH